MKRYIFATALALVTTAALGLGLQAQSPPSAAELSTRIQAHYATVKDFTADFTITATSGLLRNGPAEKGEVKVRKPGRMRWAYAGDDKKLFVADGTKLYSYFPRDKYVAVTTLPTGNDASTALLFLTDTGNLTRDFTASLPPQQEAGLWTLILAPKTPQTDFKTLTLQVDRQSLQLRAFTIVDSQGGSSQFRFTNLRENPGLSDREFEFVIPKGVEVR